MPELLFIVLLCLAGCTAELLDVVVAGLLLTRLLLLLAGLAVLTASLLGLVAVVAGLDGVAALLLLADELPLLLTADVPLTRDAFMLVRPSEDLVSELLVDVAFLSALSTRLALLDCSSAYLLVVLVLLVKERSGCCLS